MNVQSQGQHHLPVATGAMDMGNKFYKYLGPPVGHVTPSAYDKVSYSNYDLPEFYKGKNLFLRDTIDGFIMEDNRWYTTVALPWAQTDQLHLVWNEWHFNTALADRVPHEGISRLITSSKRQFKTHVVRRGLAFVMEADHFSTPEGDIQYQRNVLGIAQSVQETQDHDTIFALLTSKTYFRMWQEMYGRMSFSYEKLLEDEISNYGAIIQDDTRLEIVYEQNKRVMRKQGVTPDLLIMGPGTSIYLTMGQPERTQYWKAGPDGVLMFKNGPRSLATFRDGVNVFETRDFDVYTDEPPVQLLTRQMHISEYYGMLAKEFRSEEIGDYQTKWRDTYLYDENRDNFVKITFRDAFINLKIFDSSGNYRRSLKDLVERYRSERRVPKRSPGEMGGDDEDDSDGWGSARGKSGEPPAFFLAAPDNDNLYFLIDYFGQMDLSNATAKDFEQVGQTIVAKLFPDMPSIGIGSEQEAWQDMIQLVHEIESQPYDHEYWRRLIEVNEPYSVDGTGTFRGERTPGDLMADWGMSTSLREWKPNALGSLILPQGNMTTNVEFPAGFANGPGLKTLAKESSKPDSVWREIGRRAASAINLAERFITGLKHWLPTSESIKESNRSPWFHRQDAFTVFFEQMVGVSRDPLWMAALRPVMDADGTVRGTTFGREGQDANGEIPWFPVPLFVVLGTGEGLDQNELMRLLQKVYGGVLPERVRAALEASQTHEPLRKLFSYQSVLTGQTMEIQEEFLYHSAMVPKEIRVMMLMGQNSLPALREIFSVIRNPDSYANMVVPEKIQDEIRRMRNNMLSFAFSYTQGRGTTPDNLRRIVLAIAMEKEQPQQMFDLIKTLYVDSRSSSEEKKAARTEIASLLKLFVGKDPDPDIPVARSVSAFQPKAFSQFEDGRPVAQQANLSFSEVRNDLEEIAELAGDITALRSAVNPNFNPKTQPFSVMGDQYDAWINLGLGDISGLLPSIAQDYTTRYNASIARLREVAVGVRTKVVNAVPEAQRAAWATQARGRIRGNGRNFSVVDDDAAALRAVFYRTPLTSSLALLESLSTQGATAFIRPSDPSTAHTMPYIPEVDQPRGEPFTLPNSLWQRPQYASIGSLWTDNPKQLEHMNFLSKHTRQMNMVNGRMDEDQNGDDDDALQKVFGSSSKFRKTGKSDRFPTSSRWDDDDNDDDTIGFEDRRMESVLGGEGYSIGAKPPYEWSNNGSPKRKAGAPMAFDQAGVQYSEDYGRVKTDTFVHRFAASNQIGDPFLRVAVQAFLLSRSTGTQWLKMIDNDIHVPVNIIMWRMAIEHDMSSFILMKGGLETGANLYGHSNFATGNDVTAKLIYGNYTFYSKAVVWKERNVHLLENMKPEGYRGGNNTSFIGSPREMAQRRDRDRPSIIATAIPITENELPKNMSFTGMVDVPDANPEIDMPRLSYSTAEYYDKVLWKIGARVKSPMPERDTFFERQDRINVVARQGVQAIYHRGLHGFQRWIECQGHRKRNGSYPGAAEVWNGQAKFLEKYDFASKKLE